jgi:DNA invertase Pin-like site-specific DNA recombinase
MFLAVYVKQTKDEETNQELFFRMTDFVKQRGWECEVYFEKPTPSSTRPVKRWLLQRLRDNKYDGLVVKSFNEWANSLPELILEIFELVNKGISVYSVTDVVSFDRNGHSTEFKTLFAFNKFERQIIDIKRKEAIHLYTSSGKKLGRPKGSKDNQKRKTQGYYIREDIKKMQEPKTFKRAYPHIIP